MNTEDQERVQLEILREDIQMVSFFLIHFGVPSLWLSMLCLDGWNWRERKRKEIQFL